MERKALEFKDASVDVEARTFKGYASTWTEDLMGDTILPGAFSKSIAQKFRIGRIKILWQHEQPLGMPTEMREDGAGLYVEGRISKTRLGDEALELMRDGVVSSMSIGFTIPKGGAEWDDDGYKRTIKEVDLFEFSPVTFPANPAAVITGVKSFDPRDVERILREAGYSRSQAKAIANGGVRSLREAGEANEELGDLLKSLTQLGDFARTLLGIHHGNQ